MRRKQLTDWLVYLVVRVFVCIVQAVRMETCQAVSHWLAVLACDVMGIRTREVDDNIRLAYPDLTPGQRRRFARRMWKHLFVMVCEVAHTPRKIHETNWRQYVKIRQKREMVSYFLDARPLLLVTGHFGNFEVGGYVTGLLGFPTFTVARTLDNPYLDRFVGRFRRARGQRLLAKKGSALRAEIVLESNGMLTLLGDQYAGKKGCWVDFMGRPASCHKALALFTLTTGAPMLVTYARRAGGPMRFELGLAGVADPEKRGPEMEGVRELTQWYSRMLERAIHLAPEQYWWIHRRWKGTPPKRFRAWSQQQRRRDPPVREPGGADRGPHAGRAPGRRLAADASAGASRPLDPGSAPPR